MIIEEVFEFNRKVLSKEKNEEVKLLKMAEFLQSKGFTSPESQQLIVDCLDATDQHVLIIPVAMFLAVIFPLVLILSKTNETFHPIFFTICASVVGVLLLAIILIIRQLISDERKQISNLIRRKVITCYSFLSNN